MAFKRGKGKGSVTPTLWRKRGGKTGEMVIVDGNFLVEKQKLSPVTPALISKLQ